MRSRAWWGLLAPALLSALSTGAGGDARFSAVCMPVQARAELDAYRVVCEATFPGLADGLSRLLALPTPCPSSAPNAANRTPSTTRRGGAS